MRGITMIKSLIVIFGLGTLNAWATPITFSDLENFGGACPIAENPCTDLKNHTGDDGYLGTDTDFLQLANTDEVHNWAFDVVFTPEAEEILWASVTLTHRGQGSGTEAWFIRTRPGDDPEGRKLGELDFSNRIWVTETFTLPSVVFDDIMGGSWELKMRVKDGGAESSSGIKLASAYLSGEYRAVPEPGTLALLGLGLAGMGMARRRTNA